MKISIIAALSLALASQASAQAPSAKHLSFCKSIERAAYNAMKARQAGVPMSEMLEATEKSFEGVDAPDTKDAMVSMIYEAYEQTAMRTPENQERQRVDFRDEWFLACIKGR